MPEQSITQLPSTVGSSESLARYLTQSNHIRRLDQTVSPRAFDPPHDLRLSVYRTDGLSTEKVWEIGQVHVVERMTPPRNLYGMGSIKASAVRAVHLDVEPEEGPPRHACIFGWPDGPEGKPERMSLAQELAATATLVLRTSAG